MSSTRTILLCMVPLWWQVTICLSSQVHHQSCDMRASVELLFPDVRLLFGYGNSGLYRTDGVVLTLQCSYKSSEKGHVSLDIFDVQTGDPIAAQAKPFSNNTVKLKHKSFNIIAGSQFWCICSFTYSTNPMVEQMQRSSPIKVPSIQPCTQTQCKINNGEVCYQDTHGRIINQSHSLCDASDFESINWNLGVSLDSWNKDFIAKQRTNFNYDFSVNFTSYNAHMGLCSNMNIHKFPIPIPEFCQYRILSINASSEITLSTKMDPCGYEVFGLMLMTMNGKRMITGTIHYIEESEQMELKVAAGYHTKQGRSDKFECNMFTWKRGSDPSKGSNILMHSARLNQPSVANKTWIVKGSSLPPWNADEITMIGCNQQSVVKHHQRSPFGLSIFTKQIEFFVYQLRKVSPIYDTSGQLEYCSTGFDGRAVNTPDFKENQSQCTCVFQPIISCNPIRTIRHISGKVFPCMLETEKATTKANPSISWPTTEIPETDLFQQYPWIVIAVGIFIGCLALCNVIAFLICLRQRKQTHKTTSRSSDSVTARIELLDRLPPKMIKSPISFHTSDKFFSDGSHETGEPFEAQALNSNNPIFMSHFERDSDMQSA